MTHDATHLDESINTLQQEGVKKIEAGAEKQVRKTLFLLYKAYSMLAVLRQYRVGYVWYLTVSGLSFCLNTANN